MFTANGVKYVLTTHEVTLYSVILPGQSITNWNSYLKMLWPAMEKQMKMAGLQEMYERHFAPHTDKTLFVKTMNRSVLASMNNLSKMLIDRLERMSQNVDVLQLGATINEVPFKAIRFQYPRESLARLPLDVG